MTASQERNETPKGKSMELTEVLRGGRQCDEDGVEIIMSRQACIEAADGLERKDAEIRQLLAELDRRERIHKEDFDKLSGYVREFSKLEAENATLREALKIASIAADGSEIGEPLKITDHAFRPSTHYPEGQGCSYIVEGAQWTTYDPIRCRKPECEHAETMRSNARILGPE